MYHHCFSDTFVFLFYPGAFVMTGAGFCSMAWCLLQFMNMVF